MSGKITHVLVAEKLNGTQSWYWIPELDKYQCFSEGAGDEDEEGNSKPYEPYYIFPRSRWNNNVHVTTIVSNRKLSCRRYIE